MRVFLLLVFLTGFSFSAFAADNLRHPELKKFEKDGGKAEFLGNAYGMDGWLLIPRDGNPEQAMTVYTNKEGALVTGRLLGPDGVVVTYDQVRAFKARLEGDQSAMPGAERSGVSRAERFYSEVEDSDWVPVGSRDAPYLYMFMNVSCVHCQETWNALKPAVDAGKLQLRLAPFGAQDINRIGGAALLSVEDPRRAWEAFMAGQQDALGHPLIKDGAAQGVAANGALLQKWKVTSVPFLIYRRLDDGKIAVVNGKPDNVMLLLSELVR